MSTVYVMSCDIAATKVLYLLEHNCKMALLVMFDRVPCLTVSGLPGAAYRMKLNVSEHG